MSFLPLPSLSIEIAAHPELVYQLIAAAGRGSLPGGASHGARLLEQPAPDRAVVEFTTPVFGRRVVTVEEVRFEPPHRIHYRLLSGPLPAVEEEFWLQPAAIGTVMRYSGRYQPHRPLLRTLFDRAVVPSIYRRVVWKSMLDIKAAAEARQAKSRLFPPPAGPRGGQE